MLAALAIVLMASSVAWGQAGQPSSSNILPMLKNGAPQAFVQFTQPKVTRGLALVIPSESAIILGERTGFRCVAADPQAQDPSLYFQTAKEQIAVATGTMYVALQYYDEGAGSIQIEYTRKQGQGVERQQVRLFMGDSGLWQQHVFELPDALLNGSFAEGSDFRVIAPGVFIRRVGISRVPPTQNQGVIPQTYQRPRINLPPGFQAMVYLDSDDSFDWQSEQAMRQRARLYGSWGVQDVVETIRPGAATDENGRLDAAEYGEHAAALQQVGLRWAPRFDIGSYGGLSMQMSQRFQRVLDLENETPGPVLSMWDRQLPSFYDRLMSEVSNRLGARRPAYVVISIAGDWGPLMLSSEDSRTGGRPGLWAGDPQARRSFAAFLQDRYRNPGALEEAWGMQVGFWNQASPRLGSEATQQKAADVLSWHRNSLTELADSLLESAQRAFPFSQIVLEVGSKLRYSATDLTALAQRANEHGAAMLMVTQEPELTTSYSWLWLSQVAHEYDIPFGVRIQSNALQSDLLGALYALASGGGSLFAMREADLSQPGALQVYLESIRSWRPSLPQPKIGVVYPRTALAGQDTMVFERAIRRLREMAGIDVIDEKRLDSISAQRYPIVIVPHGNLWSEEAVSAFDRFARQGGALLVYSDGPWQTLAGEVEFNEALFAIQLRQTSGGWQIEPQGSSNLPTHGNAGRYRVIDQHVINLGAPSSDRFLRGDWSEPVGESLARAYGLDLESFRWMGPNAYLGFTLEDNRPKTLHIEGFLPEGEQVRVTRRTQNGEVEELGVIEGMGHMQWQATIEPSGPPRLRSETIHFTGGRWNTGRVLGATQTQTVTMAVSRAGITNPGQNLDAAQQVQTDQRPEFSRGGLRGSWMREVGQGITVFAPARYVDEWVFFEMVKEVLMNPQLLDSHFNFVLPPDFESNGVYVMPQVGQSVYINMNPRLTPVGRNASQQHQIPPQTILYVGW